MLTAFSIWCTLCVLFTLLPFIPSNHYLVRGWDFPILQLAGLTLLGLIGLVISFSNATNWQWLLLIATLAAFIYHCTIIFPYTFLATAQVKKTVKFDQGRSLKLLSSNVLMDNRETDKLKQQISKENPDVVLILEPDSWWQEQFRYLEKDYPYGLQIPLDNFYGMMLYSRFPLENTQAHYLIEDDIPSIFTDVVLPSGERVKLYCVHPKPPSPTENEESTERDAELLLVAKIAKEETQPSIAMGDLNDVAWSQTTRLFQKISGMLDPRIGRRPYATFHAGYPIFRWPLDHFFHSQDFQLVTIKRLPNIESDHFPIFIHLALTKMAEPLHDPPQATAKEEKEATEKIIEGMEKAEQ
ncbi:MAG: endonuclease/exonuclease/phosphatase family protein [Saprospiraceae bacterium]